MEKSFPKGGCWEEAEALEEKVPQRDSGVCRLCWLGLRCVGHGDWTPGPRRTGWVGPDAPALPSCPPTGT